MERKTVNLSENDVASLAPYLGGQSPHAVELARFVGERAPKYGSESAVLRALVLAGAKAVREQLMEEGYVELAASYAEEGERFADASIRMAAEAWREE